MKQESRIGQILTVIQTVMIMKKSVLQYIHLDMIDPKHSRK